VVIGNSAVREAPHWAPKAIMTYEDYEDDLMDTVVTIETLLALPQADDDDTAAVTVPVPAPRRPDPQDSAIAVPEPNEDGGD
jgi:hypothetical protein